MQKYTIRLFNNKMKSNIILIFLNILSLLMISCTKDNSNSLPLIKLKNISGYTTNKSYLTNHIVKLGIIANGQDANITNLVIKCTGKNFTKTVTDEGFNINQLEIDKIFTNVWGDTLNWSITVMDKNRNFASLNITTYDTSKIYAPINYFPNIEMGMQDNLILPQLLNAPNGTLYTINQGLQSPELIDVLCYFYYTSGTPSYTFSSAGDSDAPTYYPSISSFNPKNYTDWDYSTQVTTIDFDNCNNDSLLIASFHSGVGFSSRKYKFADAGKVVPFKTSGNKAGLIKVISVEGNEAGKIVFDLKIQK